MSVCMYEYDEGILFRGMGKRKWGHWCKDFNESIHGAN